MTFDRSFYSKEKGGFIERWLARERAYSKSEVERDNWAEVVAENGIFARSPVDGRIFELKTYVRSVSERAGILYIDFSGLTMREFVLNGKRVKINLADSLFAHHSEARERYAMAFDFPITLNAGWNTLEIRCENKPLRENDEKIVAQVRFIGDDGTLMKNIVTATETLTAETTSRSKAQIRRPLNDRVVISLKDIAPPATETSWEKASTRGFTAGIGKENPAFGRFGFTKGDGLLDCAMPYLGVIDKMYLFGSPAYDKLSRWMINMVPPGITPAQKWKGNRGVGKRNFGIGKNDSINVKWLSVKWATQYRSIAKFYEREKGATVNFSCSYSLATPGILVETDDPALSLKGLLTVSAFNRLLLPLASGVTLRDTSAGGAVYDREKDGELADNWILLWGAKTFPEIPLLIIPQKKPKEIIFFRNHDGSLDRVDIHTPPAIGSAIVMTPFGIESFTPREAAEDAWITTAARNAAFWSKAALAFPESCDEYYRVDEDRRQIEILDQFSHRLINDEWNSRPLVTAPLPPPLSILDTKSFVGLPEDTRDFRFPTKYGLLKGVVGRTHNRYRVPIPPLNRKFPLRNAGDTAIIAEMAEDTRSYLDFHDAIGARKLSYCASSGFMTKYAHPLALFNCLSPALRAAIETRAKKSIAYATNPKMSYDYAFCRFSHLLYDAPDKEKVLELYKNLKPAKKLYPWYWRREPFTGIEYMITYINVHVLNRDMKTGSKREVLHFKEPLIENDWGVGNSLYATYLIALIAGQWGPVRDNWETLKKGFHYFHVLNDWACMGSSYAENGQTWQEGGNYGAFVGMTQMAKIIGDRQTYEHALYLSAKNAFLRLALLPAAQTYFHKYLRCEPYWNQKFFHDDACEVGAFTNATRELRKGVRQQALYNWTTEGLYPEVFLLIRKYLPEYFYGFRDKIIEAWPDWLDKQDERVLWHGGDETRALGLYQTWAIFMICAMDNRYDKKLLLRQLEKAAENGRFPLSWFGAHMPERHIPKNTLKCQIKTLAMSSEHPAWLEQWENVSVIDAEYNGTSETATIRFASGKNGSVTLGLAREPRSVEVDGTALKQDQNLGQGAYLISDEKLIARVDGAGVLNLRF